MSLSLSETDLVSDMYVGLSFPTYKMGLILVLTSQGCHAVMPLNCPVLLSQPCQGWLPFSFLPFSEAPPLSPGRLCSWLCPGVTPAPDCLLLSRLKFGLPHHYGASLGQGSQQI